MAKLDDLTLDPDAKPDVDMENLPEEFGDFSAPPYPGNYTFQLPHELDFESFKATVLGKKDTERIRVNFDSAHPLLVMAATPENADEVGKMITMYRISNAEFEFTKGGEKVRASEMAFLLKGGLKGDVPKNASNLDWAQALNAKAGEMFGAERVEEFLRECHTEPMADVAQKLLESVCAYWDTAPQADDITIVLVRRLAG